MEAEMSVIRGRIVQTFGEDKPYKVVLEHEDGAESEHPVATMREGEALIKREMPTPPRRNTARDHAS
jgi:hypothetical protein